MALYNSPLDAKTRLIDSEAPFYYVKGKKKDMIYAKNEKEEDVENAGEMLYNFLNSIQDSTELEIYLFTELPKNGKVTSCNPLDGEAFTFKKKEIYDIQEKKEYYGTAHTLMHQMMQRMEERDRKMDERMELMLSMMDAEDDQEVEEKADPNSISGLLSNPHFMAIASTFVTNLFNPNNTVKPVAMAGTDPKQSNQITNEELTAMVNQLFAKGVTVEHLQKLIEMPDLKFKSLLMML